MSGQLESQHAVVQLASLASCKVTVLLGSFLFSCLNPEAFLSLSAWLKHGVLSHSISVQELLQLLVCSIERIAVLSCLTCHSGGPGLGILAS